MSPSAKFVFKVGTVLLEACSVHFAKPGATLVKLHKAYVRNAEQDRLLLLDPQNAEHVQPGGLPMLMEIAASRAQRENI